MPRDVSKQRNTEADALDEFTKSGEELPFGRGWSSDRRSPQVKQANRTPQFKVPDNKEVPFKFLEDTPLVSFFQHWVPQEGGKNVPYVCLGVKIVEGKEVNQCPLCGRGSKAKAANWFNVVDLSELDEDGNIVPTLKVWMASPDPSKAIEERAKVKRTSPLNRDDLYWVAYKTYGANDIPSYSIDPVKKDELLTDVGIEPLTDDQIASFMDKLYDKSIVQGLKTKAELKTISDKYLDD